MSAVMSQFGAAPQDHMVFSMVGSLFALRLNSVREVLRPMPVTRVPMANPCTAGLINVRGTVVPLVDPRPLWGAEITPDTDDTRTLIVDVPCRGGEVIVAGIRVDLVRTVLPVLGMDIRPAPHMGLDWPAGIVSGVVGWGDEFVYLLDLAGLFTGHLGLSSEARGG